MNATAVTTKMQHALTFGAHEVRTITREGQRWISNGQLTELLGYADEKSVHRLYTAHGDEFTHTMARVFRVATAGGKQAVRFFSLRGAHLVAMFARTPVAKAFRVWVLNVLDQESAQVKVPPAQKYYFPLATCKPPAQGDGFDHQAQFDLESLTDPRNPAPELDLIKQLERDGHDVTGARVRILALRHQLDYMLMDKARMGVWQERLSQMVRELGNYQRVMGLGALFSHEPQGFSRIGFEAQLPDYDDRKYGFRKVGGAA